MSAILLNDPHLSLLASFYAGVNDKRKQLTQAIILLATLSGKKQIDILIADDDSEGREIFIDAIKEVSPAVNVHVAINGKELMNTLNKEATLPDLIFLDLNMPFKNGQECLEEIRNDNKLKDIPVIIYSTSHSVQHIDETYKRGADFYVPKPDTFKELKWIASKILSLNWAEHIRPRREKFVLVADRA